MTKENHWILISLKEQHYYINQTIYCKYTFQSVIILLPHFLSSLDFEFAHTILLMDIIDCTEYFKIGCMFVHEC